MDRAELETILQSRNISPLAYCLTGGLPCEAYTLDRAGATWSVYYSERGQRTGEREFDSEDAACRYLLQLVTADSTTRRH